MITKSLGRGFTTKQDKSGRVRLTKVYGVGLNTSKKIAMRKSNKTKPISRKAAMKLSRP